MIQQIKNNITILEVANKYAGLELTRKGDAYWGKCLTNVNERTPSLQIFPHTNRFRCFSCNSFGDQIDLASLALKTPLKDVIPLMAKDLGLDGTITHEKWKEIQRAKIERDKERRRRQEQLNRMEKEYRRLTDILKLMYSFLSEIKEEEDLDRFEIIKSLQNKELLEYYLDEFLTGDFEDRLKLIEITEKWDIWGGSEINICEVLQSS